MTLPRTLQEVPVTFELDGERYVRKQANYQGCRGCAFENDGNGCRRAPVCTTERINEDGDFEAVSYIFRPTP